MDVTPRWACPSCRWSHHERNALVSHLDGMGVPELVRSKATSNTSRGGGARELAAS